MTHEPLRDEPLRDEPYEPEVREAGTVFRGRVWDVRAERFSYGGQELTREFIAHPGAVAVLALDERDRVLLIRQYRHPIRYREWEVPAGLLDVVGEPPLAGAQRELAEEADARAMSWHVLADLWTTPGASDELVRVYLARELSELPQRYERTAEEADIEVRWAALDEALTAVLRGEVRNGIAMTAILAAHAARARGWRDLRPADVPLPARPARGAGRGAHGG